MHRLLALSPLLLIAACFNDPRPGGSGTTDSTGGSTSDPGTDASTSSDGTSSTTGHEHGPTTSGPWTTGTGDDTGTSSSGSTTGDDVDPGCAMYCQAMMSSCAGALGQYSSLASCLGVCTALPPGAPGETTGNSLACRAYHAGMAEIDPALHCVHAGPGGGGACGSNCDGFCAIATATCPSEHPDLGACAATCAAFPDTEPYDIGDAAGDTLACRLYHLTVAATDAGQAMIHCPHTTEASPPCQ